MRRLFLALAFLVSLATPARADVDLTLDAQSLTRLLSILAPPTVQVGMAIVDKIDAVAGDVFRHRPVLGKRDWMKILIRSI